VAHKAHLEAVRVHEIESEQQSENDPEEVGVADMQDTKETIKEAVN